MDLPETNLPSGGAGIIVQKDSYLKDILDFQIQRDLQSGTIKKIVEKYTMSPKKIKETSDCGNKGARSLGFTNTFLPFALLLASFFLAILLSVSEKIYGKEKKDYFNDEKAMVKVQHAIKITKEILSSHSSNKHYVQQYLINELLQIIPQNTPVKITS